jgi:hypothetical protein
MSGLNANDQASINAVRILVEKLSTELGLDYSESSATSIDGVLGMLASGLTFGPEQPRTLRDVQSPAQYQAAVKLLAEYKPGTLQLVCSGYLAEVACRQLGGEWTARRKFLRGSVVGVDFRSRGLFFPVEECADSEAYSAIKKRVLARH